MHLRPFPRCELASVAMILVLALGHGLAADQASAAAEGDPTRGAAAFGVCAACHSLKPGQQLTGPSLAAIWQRRAASVEGFHRYSDALKRSTLVWDERTLDAWLKNPIQLIPGNEMVFPGIPVEQERRNLIAFLRGVSEGRIKPPAAGAMGGGMRKLSDAQPDELVTKITYCGDGYRVTTASGKTRTLWEFNLRFKTDSSPEGPREGHPVLLVASMRGDRAFVIFSRPEEISTTVRRVC